MLGGQILKVGSQTQLGLQLADRTVGDMQRLEILSRLR